MRPAASKKPLPGVAYLGLVARAPFSGLATATRTYAANLRARAGNHDLHPSPTAGDRILAVCPHPDDEVLALGGLLQRAAAVGARVKIVYLTCGDGFPVAAYSEMRGLGSLGRACRLLGVARQHEARGAIAELGLPPETALFLGYPDGGLRDLWLNHWYPSHLYRSPYTRVDRVPYEDAPRHGAPYCALGLLHDLARLLREECPTRIYAPHPLDDHGDHWATFAFLTAALRDGRNGRHAPAAVYCYLIHRGDWPAPQGRWEGSPLGPPAHLADGAWSALPLTGEERAAKRRALCRHRSQVRSLGRFLNSFLRTNELFETAAPLAPSDASLGLAEDARLAPGVFRVRHPCCDAPLRASVPSADLIDVTVRRDGAGLQALLRLAGPVSAGISYHLALHPLDPAGPPLRATWRGRDWDLSGATGEARQSSLELHLESGLLEDSRPLFVTAWTQLGPIHVDRACIELAPVRARATMNRRPPSQPVDGD